MAGEDKTYARFRTGIVTEAKKMINAGMGGGRPLKETAVMTLDDYKRLGKSRFRYHRGKNRSEGLKALWKEAGQPGLHGKNWCGAFVNVVLKRAGAQTGYGRESRFDSWLKSLFSASGAHKHADKNRDAVLSFDLGGDLRRNETKRNTALSVPGVIQPGDVVIFGNRHLGVVISYSAGTGKLVTAEGNTWGAPGISRAMTKSYYLRTDTAEGKKALSGRFSRLAASGKAPRFVRYVPKAVREARERTDAASHGREGARSSETTRGRFQSPATGRSFTQPPRDAGPAGGVPMTPEMRRASLGHFRTVTNAAEAAALIEKHGRIGATSDSKIHSRGASSDVDAELSRLREFRIGFRNWGDMSPALSRDAKIQKLERRLDSDIESLRTYAAEREPQPGIKGDASVTVQFDGRRVIIHKPGLRDVVFDKGVASGNGEFISSKDTSKRAQQARGRGPIPAGTYWLDQRQITTVIDPRDWHSWGLLRLTIHPYKTTATFGRGGFFVHGGSVPGSAGCIDIPGRIGEFLAALKKKVPDQAYRVNLVVDYGPGKVRWAKARLDAAGRAKIAREIKEILRYNNSTSRKLAPEHIAALERSFGMKISNEARKGKVSGALVWNIAAWQKEQQSRGVDTGGLDGKIGSRTLTALKEQGMFRGAGGEPGKKSGERREKPRVARRDIPRIRAGTGTAAREVPRGAMTEAGAKRSILLGNKTNRHDDTIVAAAQKHNVDPSEYKILLAKESNVTNKSFPAPAGELGSAQFTYDTALAYTRKGETLVDIEGKARGYYTLRYINGLLGLHSTKVDAGTVDTILKKLNTYKGLYEGRKAGLATRKRITATAKKRYDDAIGNLGDTIAQVEKLRGTSAAEAKKGLAEVRKAVAGRIGGELAAIKNAIKDDWRTDMKKCTERGAQHLGRLLNRYKKYQSGAAYELAYATHKLGSIRKGTWEQLAEGKIKSGDLAQEVVKTYTDAKHRKTARELSGRFAFRRDRLRNGTFRSLTFDRFVVVGDTAKKRGTGGSLDRPYVIAGYKDTAAKKYTSEMSAYKVISRGRRSGTVYGSLDEVMRALHGTKWKDDKKLRIGEGKSIDEASNNYKDTKAAAKQKEARLKTPSERRRISRITEPRDTGRDGGESSPIKRRRLV